MLLLHCSTLCLCLVAELRLHMQKFRLIVKSQPCSVGLCVTVVLSSRCVELVINEQMSKYKARLKDISSLEFAENKARSRLSHLRRTMVGLHLVSPSNHQLSSSAQRTLLELHLVTPSNHQLSSSAQLWRTI